MFAGLAHLVFWVALLVGALTGELRLRGSVLFVALWVAGYAGAARVHPEASGAFLFAAYAAILGIVLVLKVFGGDVRLR